MLRPKATSPYRENEAFITQAYPTIATIADSTEHWMRFIRLSDLQAQYSGKINGEFTGEQLFQTANELFEQVAETFRIKVPFTFTQIEDPTGNKFLVTVVNRVEGQDIQHMQLEDIKKLSVPINTLYGDISSYYLRKLRDGGFFLTDICGPSQYVYGHIGPDTSPNPIDMLHLIDADIYLDNRKASLALTVYWLSRHLSWLEYRLGTHILEARRNIELFLSEYPDFIDHISNKNQNCLSEIRGYLSERPFGDPILPAIPTFDGA